ncbi:hypothetical protein ACFO25_13130 [Paenactinomyces guangxiensis]|uniref:Uncharacterized protein n=1 Tax=Paenactinomyces guangxiensis TaxID=1490290 RepID=A0A7W1WNZ9_9BACL|nr:hypothetical protein [Paenactinomyces guangxiensis]MBA4493392.1 hypothetical protein [Paenactinomyces guangxiensis]MBH8590482.1 hypothetical protein [Paenactinomyces guangxiensis]
MKKVFIFLLLILLMTACSNLSSDTTGGNDSQQSDPYTALQGDWIEDEVCNYTHTISFMPKNAMFLGDSLPGTYNILKGTSLSLSFPERA